MRGVHVGNGRNRPHWYLAGHEREKRWYRENMYPLLVGYRLLPLGLQSPKCSCMCSCTCSACPARWWCFISPYLCFVGKIVSFFIFDIRTDQSGSSVPRPPDFSFKFQVLFISRFSSFYCTPFLKSSIISFPLYFGSYLPLSTFPRRVFYFYLYWVRVPCG